MHTAERGKTKTHRDARSGEDIKPDAAIERRSAGPIPPLRAPPLPVMDAFFLPFPIAKIIKGRQ